MTAPAPCPQCGGPVTDAIRSTKKFCSRNCCSQFNKRKAYLADPRGQIEARNARRRHYRLTCGIRCKWCEATPDDGVAFASSLECEPCERARKRVECVKCGGPVRIGYGGNISGRPAKRCHCVQPCPPGYVEVCILNDADERERILWRRERLVDPNHVCVGGKMFPREQDELTVVTLPVKMWVGLRA